MKSAPRLKRLCEPLRKLRLASALSGLAVAILGLGPLQARAADNTSDESAFGAPVDYDTGQQSPPYPAVSASELWVPPKESFRIGFVVE